MCELLEEARIDWRNQSPENDEYNKDRISIKKEFREYLAFCYFNLVNTIACRQSFGFWHFGQSCRGFSPRQFHHQRTPNDLLHPTIMIGNKNQDMKKKGCLLAIEEKSLITVNANIQATDIQMLTSISSGRQKANANMIVISHMIVNTDNGLNPILHMTDMHIQVIEQKLIETQGKSQYKTNIVKVTNGAPHQTTKKRIVVSANINKRVVVSANCK